MSSARPCTCERFSFGRFYDPDRDCAKCWLYAHHRSVRRAWGGDPADCDSLFAARRNMSAAELTVLFEGPVLLMPEDWRFWPVTQQAHLMLADKFIANMPAYPEGRFVGRGAVICGGGRYEAGAYVACRMLRHVGWRHPIQVWHRGSGDPVSDRLRRIPGVTVVDAEVQPARVGRRLLGGWESKMFAIINCPFEEVLFLDADCYPVCDPDECFELRHNPFGIVVWPDIQITDNAVHWPSYGLEPDGKAGLNGGHYVIAKRQVWPALQLAAHFDNHSDYYYWYSAFDVRVGAFSDQEQVRAALHKLNLRSHRYTKRPIASVCNSCIQGGPRGRTMFVHRWTNKLALPSQFGQPPRWYPGELPMEATAWRYFLEWITEPPPNNVFPEEVPGWFTRAECDLWRNFCEGRDVLELGRHHGRSTVVAALSARKVVSIDRDGDAPADLWLQRYGVRHKVWLRVGEFADLAATSGGPFSACLIDGAHDRRSVDADIRVAVAQLTPGAVVAFHDYGDPDHHDVQSAVDAAAQRFGWRLLKKADFLAVFETADVPECRPIHESISSGTVAN